jgi:hypothetical protein
LDLNDYSLRTELVAIRADLMTLVERLAVLEVSMTTPSIMVPDIVASVQPLMLDGVFEPNTPGEVSTILRMPNESTETIHFTPRSLGFDHDSYIFGRLLRANGKKIEGVFSVELVKTNEDSTTRMTLLKSTTEKLNFSHPTKQAQRLIIEGDHCILEPGDAIEIKLESKHGFDAISSKLVFEDLIFVEAQQ